MSLLEYMLSNRLEILEQTYEHVWITLLSIMISSIIGMSVGLWLTRNPKWSNSVIGIAGVIQTIPSLALLGFLLPIMGIGVVPAITALFLYALLPIIRNTYTGITEVDQGVVEAARGMGLTSNQILLKVELPLAMPVIFAGLRTATVINVGIATLCALIAAGGLGELIFRGISVNNINMILAGAIPASLLALTLDFLLGLIQKHITKLIRPLLILISLLLLFATINSVSGNKDTTFQGGFIAEFMEREDGYPGLSQLYGLEIEAKELDVGLIYEALKNKEVDVISGFSTDGRIPAYDIRVLEDDLNYFPPYYASAMMRGQVFRKFPELQDALKVLEGQVTESLMMDINYLVDQEKVDPSFAAEKLLERLNIETVPKKQGSPDIVIGSKAFTENYILAHAFSKLIEARTDLTTELKQGFGGTKLLFDAMRIGEIDLYPEYTGTSLLVLIQPDDSIINAIMRDKEAVYNFVKAESRTLFDIEWLEPLGFNNTTALMMREESAEAAGIISISDLKDYLENIDK